MPDLPSSASAIRSVDDNTTGMPTLVAIAAVPRNTNDKVDRKALPEPTAADLPSARGGSAPADDDERAVARVFAETLATEVEIVLNAYRAEQEGTAAPQPNLTSPERAFRR